MHIRATATLSKASELAVSHMLVLSQTHSLPAGIPMAFSLKNRSTSVCIETVLTGQGWVWPSSCNFKATIEVCNVDHYCVLWCNILQTSTFQQETSGKLSVPIALGVAGGKKQSRACRFGGSTAASPWSLGSFETDHDPLRYYYLHLWFTIITP